MLSSNFFPLCNGFVDKPIVCLVFSQAVTNKIINNPKISKGSSSSHLPRRLDLGITYYPFEQLTTTFAVERILGYDESSFRFGVEYNLNSSLL